MKLKRAASIPFALLADVVTLGNMGDRSYTQQVFDAARRDEQREMELETLRLLVEALKEAK